MDALDTPRTSLRPPPRAARKTRGKTRAMEKKSHFCNIDV